MADLLDKVVTALEICTMTTRANRCLKCPYTKEERDTNKWCTQGLHRDALSLLKAQGPKQVYITGQTSGIKVGMCPNCGNAISSEGSSHFCGKCGRAVKWDG